MSSEGTLIFRQESMPSVVVQTLQRLGWEEHDDEVHAEDEWNIFWKPTRPTMGEYHAGKEYQKHIHFPKTGILCKKDSLARLIKKNRNMFGKIYDFSPTTYFLPNEYKKFIEAFTRAQTNGEAKTNIWICKPSDSSRGRGISIINDISNLQYDQQSVIQKYISNAHLISGSKWDMRIYVLITCARPMKLYLFKEGLVRFSSARYDCSNLTNQYSHLTNSSINKYASSFGGGTSYGTDGKWTMAQLKSYFVSNNLNWDTTWVKIETIITCTCLNLINLLPDLDCCFELLGFDVMLDSNLKPWLIEVNSGPAMAMDGRADQVVKPALIKDMIGLLNFEPYKVYKDRTTKPTKKAGSDIQSFFSKRNTNSQVNCYSGSGSLASSKGGAKQIVSYPKQTFNHITSNGYNSHIIKKGKQQEQDQKQESVNYNYSNKHLGYASSSVRDPMPKSTNKGSQGVQERSGRSIQNSVNRKTSGVTKFPHCPGSRQIDGFSAVNESTDTFGGRKKLMNGSDMGNTPLDLVTMDDINSSCGTLAGHANINETRLSQGSNNKFQNRENQIQTFNIHREKSSRKNDKLFQSFNESDINIPEKKAKSRVSMNAIPDNSSRSFPGYNKHKRKQMSNTYQRGKQKESDRYSSQSDFSCLEEENEECTKENSEEQDSPGKLTDITDKKRAGKMSPFGTQDSREPRIIQQSKPLLPRSHMSTTGSSSYSSTNKARVNNRQSAAINKHMTKSSQFKITNAVEQEYGVTGVTSSRSKYADGKPTDKQSGCQTAASHNRLRTTDASARFTQQSTLGTRDKQKSQEPVPKKIAKGGSTLTAIRQNSNVGQGNVQATVPTSYSSAVAASNNTASSSTTKTPNNSKQVQQQPQLLFEKGMFDRPKSGQFELIFPFNKKTEDFAVAFNRASQSKTNTIGGPNYLKMLVEEVKSYEAKYMEFVKNHRSYEKPQQPKSQMFSLAK